MADRNRRLVLSERPSGIVDDRTMDLDDSPVPDPGPGQALVHVRYLSIDPTIRTWMNDAEGYLPPIGIGEVVRGGGLGEIVRTNSDDYAVGDVVFGMTGWQDYTITGQGHEAMRVIPPGVDPLAVLSVFGATGMTAYFGVLDVGRVVAGDTVVVSGAAGATGSLAGQIARLKDASPVVGIAGTADKCRWLLDELGFDAAINYRTERVDARLREVCPRGIDLYFDNVGGTILDTCLAQLALHGRVVLCGAISTYNHEGPPPGLRNYRSLILKRARMEGFLVLDYLDRFPEAQVEMAGWVGQGLVKHAEHIVEGLESAPEALNLLFSGGNRGKVIVQL
jgi:NADPH-dependent curcumin reductase CurA